MEKKILLEIFLVCCEISVFLFENTIMLILF